MLKRKMCEVYARAILKDCTDYMVVFRGNNLLEIVNDAMFFVQGFLPCDLLWQGYVFDDDHVYFEYDWLDETSKNVAYNDELEDDCYE